MKATQQRDTALGLGLGLTLPARSGARLAGERVALRAASGWSRPLAGGGARVGELLPLPGSWSSLSSFFVHHLCSYVGGVVRLL